MQEEFGLRRIGSVIGFVAVGLVKNESKLSPDESGHVVIQQGADEGATLSIALLAMTQFAPIAWSHYYIILLVPMIWLIARAKSRPVLWLPIALLLAVSATWSYSLYRPLFLGGLVVMLTCLVLSYPGLLQRDRPKE